jgi:hypothetical protein
VVGGIYNPNHQTSRLVEAVYRMVHRTVSGAPATSPGRWVLTVGALTAGPAWMSGGTPNMYCRVSGGTPDSPVRQTKAAFRYPLLSLLNPSLGLFIG